MASNDWIVLAMAVVLIPLGGWLTLRREAHRAKKRTSGSGAEVER